MMVDLTGKIFSYSIPISGEQHIIRVEKVVIHHTGSGNPKTYETTKLTDRGVWGANGWMSAVQLEELQKRPSATEMSARDALEIQKDRESYWAAMDKVHKFNCRCERCANAPTTDDKDYHLISQGKRSGYEHADPAQSSSAPIIDDKDDFLIGQVEIFLSKRPGYEQTRITKSGIKHKIGMAKDKTPRFMRVVIAIGAIALVAVALYFSFSSIN